MLARRGSFRQNRLTAFKSALRRLDRPLARVTEILDAVRDADRTRIRRLNADLHTTRARHRSVPLPGAGGQPLPSETEGSGGQRGPPHTGFDLGEGEVT